MVKVKFNNSNAQLPVRAKNSDAGADLFCSEDITIEPLTTGVVKTGITIQADDHAFNLIEIEYSDVEEPIIVKSYFRVAPKSGLALKGLIINAGVIDIGYTGDVDIVVFNTSKEPYTFTKGSKVAQIIREFCIIDEYKNSNDIESTDRGSAGWGSTGK